MMRFIPSRAVSARALLTIKASWSAGESVAHENGVCSKTERTVVSSGFTVKVQPVAHLGQELAPPRQRLMHQATASVIEQIEEHVPHRTPVPGLANPPRIGQAVPAQQPRQIGPTVVVERHQFSVYQRPRRQATEDV